MKIHLQWGLRRRRTQRRRPEIQLNEYTANLFRWGLRRQRIQKSHRPRKPPTCVPPVTRTSSNALPQSVVQQLNLTGSAIDTVQPVEVVRQHNLIASTSNTVTQSFLGPSPQSVVRQHNINASTSNMTQPLHPAVSPTIDPLGGRRSLTIFGCEDYNLLRTKEFLRKQNVSIVIRDESELNIMLKSKMKHLESNASYKGKGKGKENQTPTSPVYWPDKVKEWRRIHTTRLRGWGIDNTVYVMTGLRWPYFVGVDTSTFRRLMYRTYGKF